MKKLCLLLVLIFVLPCLACAEIEEKPVRIMVASDIHYISPTLYKDSSLFLRAIANGDGKAAMYSEELLEALILEAKHQQSDVLILTGDLTFNGAKVSHEEFASALRTLSESGIPVYVIPGNHDINNRSAIRYLDTAYQYVENVDSALFGEIWQDFLAEDMKGPGFSGLVRASDHVWIALGDYSVYETYTASYGVASEIHNRWMKELTAVAKENGATLISASHQALSPHTNFSASSFCVWSSEQIMNMLIDAGCEINLSGHMHLQHILNLNRFADIATGAWSVYPHRYGMVTVEPDGSVSYQAHAVCAEHTPEGMLSGSREFFRTLTAEKERSELEMFGFPAASIEMMLEYAKDVNEAYFSGTLSQHPELLTDAAREKWISIRAASTFAAYMVNLLDEPIEEACAWSSSK